MTVEYVKPPSERWATFDVYEEIGRGGLATRHRARHADGEVVLERLRTNLSGDWELVNAFVQEALLASQLRHRHLARTYTYGRHAGVHYCTSELVPGPSLREVLRQANTAAGAVPIHVAVALLVQIVDVLRYLHAQRVRVIHRDVTPENFVVSTTGELKLVDLGLAQLPARAPTRIGVVKGTPGYIAPEAASGAVDERADLFAVGVIAYELLTGQRPSPTDLEHLAPPSRANAQVDAYLDDIVMSALQVDLSARWQNAAAMHIALANYAFDLGEPAASDVRAWLVWAFERTPRRSTAIKVLVDAIDRDFRRAG